ncbi:hypothetical protein [Microbacterium allomyrinae]|uniref:Uncharacterized protein n=1 Tax=Microbacterium allomyrinae TaxID=2830666 RepID=A0A9X1S293_9MICO|nr:hypothetical protein [Microbacterium allomyrinae]MCC2030658.1 hypothetical protein [Microbacterium allomyrinae]
MTRISSEFHAFSNEGTVNLSCMTDPLIPHIIDREEASVPPRTASLGFEPNPASIATPSLRTTRGLEP